METRLNFFCLLVVMVIQYIGNSEGRVRVKRGFCSLRNLDIANGDYSIRGGNSVVEYRCNMGFTLYGAKQVVCFGSKWSSDPPMCIANTCTAIQANVTLRIEREFNGAVLKFSCSVLHKLVGADTLICDGKNWNDQVPTCEAYDPPTSCDFESGVEACGWFQHDKDEQDWMLNTGSTRTTRTGPTHDHTLGPNGEGHYMYFETSSPTRPDHQAILESPLYPASYSYKCFKFWYHIYGEKDIGTLEAYIVPDGRVGTEGLTAAFLVHENLGEEWHEHNITIPIQQLPFQIWFVATRQMSYRSDFAIDDVSLFKCRDEPSTTAVSTVITTANPTRTQRVTTVTARVATTATTTPVVRTTVKPTTTTTTPVVRTTVKPTTKQPQVTTRVTYTPTTLKTSNPPTEPFHTTASARVSTTKKIQPRKTTNSNTGTPPINPETPRSQMAASMATERNDAGKIAYILLGVGLVAAIAIAVIVGVYVYRRKQKHEISSVSLCSENPLYHEIENQEACVRFANQDENPYNECEY